MSEPTSITAGDTVVWEQEYDNADGDWTFAYKLLNDDGKIEIATTAAAGSVSVLVAAADTEDWANGRYKWFLYRSKDSERYLVATGHIEVCADPEAADTLATKTHAEKMLALIETRLEGRITSDHESYSIDGRSLSRIPFTELRKHHKDYAWQVFREHQEKGLRKPHKRIVHR